MNSLKNIEYPFVELYSLMKGDYNYSTSQRMLDHSSEVLVLMNQHAENAIDILLRGLQSLGQIIGFSGKYKNSIIDEIANIGFFISAITSLTEVLNIMREDVRYILVQRGVMND